MIEEEVCKPVTTEVPEEQCTTTHVQQCVTETHPVIDTHLVDQCQDIVSQVCEETALVGVHRQVAFQPIPVAPAPAAPAFAFHATPAVVTSTEIKEATPYEESEGEVSAVAFANPAGVPAAPLGHAFQAQLPFFASPAAVIPSAVPAAIPAQRQCHPVANRVCNKVPVQTQRLVPVPQCVQVPQTTCITVSKPVTSEECTTVEKEECENVPKEVTITVDKEVCEDVPKQECMDVTEQVCKDVPHQVAKKVCKNTPLKETYNFGSEHGHHRTYGHHH